MAPFAPFYLLFIGEVIQKFLKEKENKTELKKFLLYMMAISFVGSLYHIWGLFPLPGRNTTIVFTIAVLGVMLAHFLDLKFTFQNSIKFWVRK